MTAHRDGKPLSVGEASRYLELLARGFAEERRSAVALAMLDTLRRAGEPAPWMQPVEDALRRGEWPPASDIE